VNEAKKIMQTNLPVEKMTGFSVFGIAVPSNNVAGEVQSHLTNHRDFIRFLPGALPQNWTLKRSNGDSVENIGVIQAHSFVDTYMSKNFDSRAAVVSNVHKKLKTIQQPTADCMIYRSAILSMVEGVYSTCNEPKVVTRTGATGLINSRPAYVDLTATNYPLSLGVFFPDGLALLWAGGRQGGVSLGWNAQGIYSDSGESCGDGTFVPYSRTKEPFQITQNMMKLIDKKVHYFFNSCWVKGANGKAQPLSGVVPVLVSETTIHLRNLHWNMAANLTFESAHDAVGSGMEPSDLDPGFFLVSDDANKKKIFLEYRYSKGLRRFSVLDTQESIENMIVLMCTSD
jgi:hypothetical protein